MILQTWVFVVSLSPDELGGGSVHSTAPTVRAGLLKEESQKKKKPKQKTNPRTHNPLVSTFTTLCVNNVYII